MTDQLGRTGVAVSAGTGAAEARLIIDPRTARLLAYESGPRSPQGLPRLAVVYQATAWVDRLGARG